MRDLITYIFISLFLLAVFICALAIFNMIVFSPWLFLYYQRKNKEMPKYVTWFIRNTNNQVMLLFIVTMMAVFYPTKDAAVKHRNKFKESK